MTALSALHSKLTKASAYLKRRIEGAGRGIEGADVAVQVLTQATRLRCTYKYTWDLGRRSRSSTIQVQVDRYVPMHELGGGYSGLGLSEGLRIQRICGEMRGQRRRPGYAGGLITNSDRPRHVSPLHRDCSPRLHATCARHAFRRV